MGVEDELDVAEGGTEVAQLKDERVFPRALQKLEDPSMAEIGGDVRPQIRARKRDSAPETADVCDVNPVRSGVVVAYSQHSYVTGILVIPGAFDEYLF